MRAERKNRDNKSYFVDSELYLVYIYKKAFITCKTPIMIHGESFNINNNTDTPSF